MPGKHPAESVTLSWSYCFDTRMALAIVKSICVVWVSPFWDHVLSMSRLHEAHIDSCGVQLDGYALKLALAFRV